MEKSHHKSSHANHGNQSMNLRKETAKHALRCLIGCNIGEGLGAAIGYSLGWDVVSTLILAVGLAFATGYAFTIIPMLRTVSLKKAVKVAFAGDTASIASMETAENTMAFLIPGFIGVALFGAMFWLGLAIVLITGFIVSYAIMYRMMKKAMNEGRKPSCH